MVDIVHILSEILKNLIENQLATIILGALGLSGGIWLFVVKFGLTKIWQKVEPEIESAAHLADQKKKDEKLNETYQNDIKTGADEKKLIQDETDMFNSGRKH